LPVVWLVRDHVAQNWVAGGYSIVFKSRLRAFQKQIQRVSEIRSGSLLLLVLFLSSFGAFGLRDILLTSLVESVTRSALLLTLFDIIYWIALILGGVLFGVLLLQKPWKAAAWFKGKDLLVWLGLSSPFFYILLTRRLTLDFWLDEVMSIVRHIEPSISSALFWYPVPNNHVFSNFISGIYVRLLGLDSLQDLLGRAGGWIAVGLLTTTVPFLNFSVQVRGYSLTFLSAILLFYFALMYLRTSARAKAVWIGILSFTLFYLIPLNLYFLLAVMFTFGIQWIMDLRQGRWKTLSLRREHFVFSSQNLTVVLMVLLGLLAAVGAYVPIFDKVFGNRYVETEGFFNGTVFLDALPNFLRYFSSNREPILAIGLVGVLLGLRRAVRAKQQETLDFLYLGFSISALPYIFSFVRGDNPFERVFLNTMPVLMLLLAFGFMVILEEIKRLFPDRERVTNLALAVLILLPLPVFIGTYQEIESTIYENLAEEKIKAVTRSVYSPAKNRQSRTR
jgi:hypothetical protein